MQQINCTGECSWLWVIYSNHWNFLPENTTCNYEHCSCDPPAIIGEFDGQVVFTPCQQLQA